MSHQDEQFRQAMRGYAAGLLECQPLPPASVIWLRAERRRRRLAIERAERPLRIMQAVGLVCAVFAAVWMLYRAGTLNQLSTVGSRGLIWVVAGAMLMIGGCWTLVVVSRRPLS
jgi:hypothetical protein